MGKRGAITLLCVLMSLCAITLLIGGCICILNSLILCGVIMLGGSGVFFVIVGWQANNYHLERERELAIEEAKKAMEKLEEILNEELKKRAGEPFEEFNSGN